LQGSRSHQRALLFAAATGYTSESDSACLRQTREMQGAIRETEARQQERCEQGRGNADQRDRDEASSYTERNRTEATCHRAIRQTAWRRRAPASLQDGNHMRVRQTKWGLHRAHTERQRFAPALRARLYSRAASNGCSLGSALTCTLWMSSFDLARPSSQHPFGTTQGNATAQTCAGTPRRRGTAP
jgi:hypothetical protein